MKCDVLLIHPPVVYDFRRRIVFPGPLAETVSHYTTMLIAIPLGMLSIADFLERNGYKARILNLGEKMILDPNYDFKRAIKRIEAKVYGIGLHWIAHSQGSIEVARICKEIHPDSLVVLGGLTASYYHEEIIRRFDFIDCVVRGEGEKPLLRALKSFEEDGCLTSSPGLTLREEGRITVNEVEKPCETIDEYSFTRLDLVEPKELMLTLTSGLKTWTVPVCRGCTYNCVTCGGSAYSYKQLFGRLKPAFRSPEKVVEDVDELCRRGVRGIFLVMDPRIGGKKYCRELVKCFKSERPDVEQLGIELFSPASKEFLRELKSMGLPIILNISPESGNEAVRKSTGRLYSNSELMDTLKACIEEKIQTTVFFMIVLSNDTLRTLNETFLLCKKIYLLDRLHRSPLERDFHGSLLMKPRIGPMILLDPGSLAFEYPSKYGYKLVLKSLVDHYLAFNKPSWNQWINYETKSFSRREIANLISLFLEKLSYLEEVYSLYEGMEMNRVTYSRFRVKVDKFIADELDRLESIEGEEKSKRIEVLSEIVERFYSTHPLEPRGVEVREDEFGYLRKVTDIFRESTGLISFTVL